MRNTILAISICTTLLSGCGGGGSSGGGAAPATTLTGQFIDSAVQGLSYTTSTGQSGITGEGGTFSYQDGATVTFSIGGVTLGSATAQNYVTPLDLVSADTLSNTAANNITRFLMLLDNDNNPDNGISISPEIRNAADGWGPINFNSDGLDIVLTDIITHVQTLNPDAEFPSQLEANAHLIDTFIRLHGGAWEGTASGVKDCGVATPDEGGGFSCTPIVPPIPVSYRWTTVVDPVTGEVHGRVYDVVQGFHAEVSGDVGIYLAAPDANPMGLAWGTVQAAGYSADFSGLANRHTNTIEGTWSFIPYDDLYGLGLGVTQGDFTGNRIQMPWEETCADCTVYDAVAVSSSLPNTNICILVVHADNSVIANCRDLSLLTGDGPLATLTGTYNPGASTITLQNVGGTCSVTGAVSGSRYTATYACTDGDTGSFNARVKMLR